MSTKSHRNSGFTLVELVIIVPIAMLTIMGVVVALINLVSDNITTRSELSSMHDTQSAFNTIEADANIAASFLTTKDSQFSDPYGPDGAGGSWSFAGSSTSLQTLIIRGYASTKNPLDETRRPVYINQLGCAAADILSNPALTTNVIYFIRNNNLYRRVLTITSATTCATPFQKQSCPPDRATNNAICKADDSLLLTDVKSFIVDYYSDPLAGSPIDTSSGLPSTLTPAVAIRIKLKVSKVVAGQSFTYERSLFINKRNS